MSAYNHDIDVSKTFRESFPSIAEMLRVEAICTDFQEYDQRARAAKVTFHRIGVLSLIAGAVAILGAAVSLYVATLATEGSSWTHPVVVTSDALAVLSFGGVLFLRLRRVKRTYLTTCFVRERIRQWHFQSFLDGDLVQRRVSPNEEVRAAAAAEYAARWAAFQESWRNLDGSLDDFVEHPHVAAHLLHARRAYTDLDVARAVFGALRTVRFDHQVGYPQRRVSEQQDDRLLSLTDHFEMSEFVARFAFVLAVLVPVASLALSGIILVASSVTERTLAVDPVVGHAMSLGAVCLAVISAAARAYQSGFTVPAEIFSYREFAAEADHFRTRFIEAADDAGRLDALAELERTAALELRRFLAMKQRATFLL